MFQARSRLDAATLPDSTNRPATYPTVPGHTVLFSEKYAVCSYWALIAGPQAPRYRVDAASGFQLRPPAPDPSLPQSPHRSGIHVVLADGSAHCVHPSVSPAVWYELHTPAGSKPLKSDPFAK